MSNRAGRSAHVVQVAMVFCLTAALAAASDAPRHVGERADLTQLTLIKADGSKAVIRFGKGPLEMIAVGDWLGANKAEVKEIAAGRLVIAETFTGRDGVTNHAQIILKDGETGGTRYLRRSDEPHPAPAARPLIAPQSKRPGPERP